MKIKKSKIYYILIFILVLLVMHFLYSPFWGKFIYPFPYKDEIHRSALEYDLDPYLLAAIIHVESGFDPAAVSPKGARGLMQIMPETAEWAAGVMEFEAFNQNLLFEPDHNVRIGSWYLSSLMRQFNDDLIVVLAAYNGGRNRVNRWLSDGIWDGQVENIDKIPLSETRNYVQKVLNTYNQYQNIYE
ncbi:MAG: lytic transglycosylase domain-containing protein [Dethiobacteria bacterium]